VNLLKSEFLKLAYQRRTWGLFAAAIFLSVLATALTPWALSRMKNAVVMPLTLTSSVDGVYSKSLGAYILALVLGIVIMSSEFQHHTAIATFLAAPKRLSVLGAKLITAAIWGAVLNVVATGLGMVSGAIALSMYKDAAKPDSYIFVDYIASAALTGAVLALVGLAIGTLIRNQNAAVSVGLVFFLVVDRILGLVWTEGGKYLPSGLITSMMQLHIDVNIKSTGLRINTADYLDPLPAAALMFGYGIAFALISLITLSRDID
jgi:ABC-type transport system involved in multi-copper enzyme maturation permease subunit